MSQNLKKNSNLTRKLLPDQQRSLAVEAPHTRSLLLFPDTATGIPDRYSFCHSVHAVPTAADPESPSA